MYSFRYVNNHSIQEKPKKKGRPSTKHQGLGKSQLEQRAKTDEKVLGLITEYSGIELSEDLRPMTVTLGGIVNEMELNFRSVKKSIDRLKNEEKIIEMRGSHGFRLFCTVQSNLGGEIIKKSPIDPWKHKIKGIERWKVDNLGNWGVFKINGKWFKELVEKRLNENYHHQDHT